MSRPKILAFAGSQREKSFNRQLIKVAAETASLQCEVTILELGEYPLPLFDQDDEATDGLPENAKRLKEIFIDHDGLLIACPEYNSSITPLLKNTIDWVSRATEGEQPLSAFHGKVAVLLAASPGALGGLRGLVHVRSILSNIGVIVLPDQHALPRAHEEFTPDGELKSDHHKERVATITEVLGSTLRKLKSS